MGNVTRPSGKSNRSTPRSRSCAPRRPIGEDGRVENVGIEYRWRGEISDAELVALTDSYGGMSSVGWWDGIRPYSLGWVAARLATGEAAGFVNVAWDGCDHAFLIDTKV